MKIDSRRSPRAVKWYLAHGTRCEGPGYAGKLPSRRPTARPNPQLHRSCKCAIGWRSIFHWLFEEKTLWQERLGNVVDVLFGHAACAEMIWPVSNDCDYFLNFIPGLFSDQSESVTL